MNKKDKRETKALACAFKKYVEFLVYEITYQYYTEISL